MIPEKIALSLVFAGITAGLWIPGFKLGEKLNTLPLDKDSCKPFADERVGKQCRNWNNNGCYHGTCKSLPCDKNCEKPLNPWTTILLFTGTYTFLCASFTSGLLANSLD